MTPISAMAAATGGGPPASTPSASTSPAHYSTALPTSSSTSDLRRRRGGGSEEVESEGEGIQEEAGDEDEEMITLPPLNLPRSALDKLGRDRRRPSSDDRRDVDIDGGRVQTDGMLVDGADDRDVKVRLSS
jgi:hypothetical protein